MDPALAINADQAPRGEPLAKPEPVAVAADAEGSDDDDGPPVSPPKRERAPALPHVSARWSSSYTLPRTAAPAPHVPTSLAHRPSCRAVYAC